MDRPPLKPPLEPPATFGRVTVLHPAYIERLVLLSLPAYDGPTQGLYLPLVHTACAIIADNAFNGYISKDAKPSTEAMIPENNLLPAGDYYFHVPPPSQNATISEAYRYPVLPTFRDWKFPHGLVPKDWEKALEGASGYATIKCVVTGYDHSIEQAHIVPQAETEWYNENLPNNFSQAPASLSLVDQQENMISLRSDIHTLLDTRQIVFFPKPSHQGRFKMLTHCLRSNKQVRGLYHNRALNFLPEVSPESLFTRFALALFPVHSVLNIKGLVAVRCINNENGEKKDMDANFETRQTMTLRPLSTSRKRKSLASSLRDPPATIQSQVLPSIKRRRHSDSGFYESLSSEDKPEELDFDYPPRGRLPFRAFDFVEY